MVWVHEMAIYQIAESLAAKDKQVLGINKALKNLPKCPQILAFYEKYKAAFQSGEPKPLRRPFQAPPKQGTGTGEGTGC
jgi:hypothetical protein